MISISKNEQASMLPLVVVDPGENERDIFL
jgi:hypothetical protein